MTITRTLLTSVAAALLAALTIVAGTASAAEGPTFTAGTGCAAQCIEKALVTVTATSAKVELETTVLAHLTVYVTKQTKSTTTRRLHNEPDEEGVDLRLLAHPNREVLRARAGHHLRDPRQGNRPQGSDRDAEGHVPDAAHQDHRPGWPRHDQLGPRLLGAVHHEGADHPEAAGRFDRERRHRDLRERPDPGRRLA